MATSTKKGRSASDFSRNAKARAAAAGNKTRDGLMKLVAIIVAVLGFFGLVVPLVFSFLLDLGATIAIAFGGGLGGLSGWLAKNSDEPWERLLWLVFLVGGILLAFAGLGGM